MQLDATLAMQAIQLLHKKEQETMQLLDIAMAQNRLFLTQQQQQQGLLTQHLQRIRRLEAEVQAHQRSAFGLVHTN